VYLGYDSAGAPTGYAIVASEPGFQDQITLIFGYDPVGREVLGMKVLESRETPGLGDKIERPAFTAQFAGRVAPLTGVKGAPPAGDASAVVMVTGATISSRAVVEEINAAVSRWQPLIESYRAVGRP
jgi:electron transport complex protein RnfG